MRKLIEPLNLQSLVCDNEECDFKREYQSLTLEQMGNFINCACPECGENLLTEDDYNQYVAMRKGIDLINKWFSWILIFKKKRPVENHDTIKVHCHDGIKISKSKNQNHE